MLGVNVYEPFARPEKLYAPKVLALVTAVDAPESVTVAPAVPAEPEMLHVEA
jgi:hypothetical protein